MTDPMWQEVAGPPGPPGESIVGPPGESIIGPPGRDGESLNPRGKWSPSVQYEPLDVVLWRNDSYVAKLPSKGRRPSSVRFWQLLAKSIRGEKGEPGAPGPRGRSVAASGGSADDITYTGGPFLAGKVVYVTGGGSAALARADSITTARAVGMTTDSGKLRTEGQIDLAGLTPGVTYYLSPTTAGEITSVAPSTPGHLVVVVGRALSSSVLDLELAQPILL